MRQILSKEKCFLLSFYLFFCVNQSLSAAQISGLTPRDLKVTRGDQLTLRVATTGDQPTIEWWSEGRVICKSDSCVVDTSSFSPGKTVIDVVVEDESGVSLSQTFVSAMDAPPLYTPKTLTPDVLAPDETPKSVAKGQWLIVERDGGFSFTHPARPKEIVQVSMFSVPSSEAVYTVSAGGLGIIRRIGMPEQVLLSESAKFTVSKDGRFELLSGRALWRSHAESNDVTNMLVVAGGEVQVKGSSLVGLEVGSLTKNESRAIIQNFQSQSLTVSCRAKAKAVPVGIRRAGMLVLNSEFMCVGMDPEDFRGDDSSSWVSKWSPWWFTEQLTGAVDRWRSDYILFSDRRTLAERIVVAQKFKDQADCASALDVLNIRQASDKKSMDRLKIVGMCQFSLNMFGKSLGTFSRLNEMKIDPPQTAFMIGKSYQNLNRHDLALHWFDQAYARDYQPLSELGVAAVLSADAIKDGTQKLRWLEVTWWAEKESKVAARQAYVAWYTRRPKGAEVSAAVYMDSQAVPLNSKTSTPLPIKLKASRAIKTALNADWWTERPIAGQSSFRVQGWHNFQTPMAASLSFASTSEHVLGVDFKIGSFGNNGDIDRWNISTGARMGLGIVGGESQRDRYGFVMEAHRPSWTGFFVSLQSDKYFDPSPGGADLFDLDMERYTGEVDHSHVDLKFFAGFKSLGHPLGWSFSLGSGSVDYRTPEMGRYDHSLSIFDGQLMWQAADRWSYSVEGRFKNRSFNEGGSDSTQTLKADAKARLFPLWRFSLFAGYELRKVSADILTSWGRNFYGMAVQSDL